jgi:hypothetical protein
MSQQAKLAPYEALFQVPELTDDERAVIDAMQLFGAIAREDPDMAPHALQALHRLAESPEAHSVAQKISDRVAEQMDAWDDEHPDSPVPPSEEVVDYAVRRTFVAARPTPVMRTEPRTLFTVHTAPRGRSPKGRRKASRVLVGSSSGDRGDPRDDDGEPPAAACTGCGGPFTPEDPRQRYCSTACSNRTRQRRLYDARHPSVAKPEKRKPLALVDGRRDEPDPDLGFRDVDGSFVWWSEITPRVWCGRKNRVLGSVA